VDLFKALSGGWTDVQPDTADVAPGADPPSASGATASR